MNKGKLNKLVDLALIEDTCIVIGPEGDFSSKEVDLAKEHDFKLVGLGKYRLRSETAAVVACTLLNNE